jgi:hypothetical protein
MVNPLELLGYAGNLLDLPGSSVRDLLTGQNPFDQWMTPFSGDNRASGRDVLRPLLGANKETGMSGWLSDPMEGVKDVLGFGAEVALDPMNFVSGGAVLRAIKGGKAARQANAVNALREAGKYSYVNPRVLARQADEMVNPLDDMVRSTLDAKLSGPLPEDLIGGRTSFDVPENDMFDRLYMRRGARQLGKEKIDDAITVASIEARQPGSGAYRSLHNYLRGFGKPIVAEEVISPDFAAKLQHMGYEQVDSNWVYRPTADEVAPATASVAEQSPKLLGYTPELERVQHVGRDWSASATPEHPYGMFDMNEVGTGQTGKTYGPAMYVSDDPRTPKYVRSLLERQGFPDAVQYELDMPNVPLADWTTQGSAEQMLGVDPRLAGIEDLQATGYPGAMTPSSIKGFAGDRVLWDQDLIDQMRIRAIDGERVPINPTTLVQQVEQPAFRASAGDSPLVSTMNPMRPQAVPGVLRPLTAGAAYNALARQNQYGGIL